MIDEMNDDKVCGNCKHFFKCASESDDILKEVTGIEVKKTEGGLYNIPACDEFVYKNTL